MWESNYSELHTLNACRRVYLPRIGAHPWRGPDKLAPLFGGLQTLARSKATKTCNNCLTCHTCHSKMSGARQLGAQACLDSANEGGADVAPVTDVTAVAQGVFGAGVSEVAASGYSLTGP